MIHEYTSSRHCLSKVSLRSLYIKNLKSITQRGQESRNCLKVNMRLKNVFSCSIKLKHSRAAAEGAMYAAP